MICECCVYKCQCHYYSENIKPVLNTEQNRFTNDSYLRMLHEVLETFDCGAFESDESEEVE